MKKKQYKDVKNKINVVSPVKKKAKNQSEKNTLRKHTTH